MVEFITNVVDVVILVGAFAPILMQWLKYAKAKTTDKRIQLLESYAMRVVQAMEQYSDLAGANKKIAATEKLKHYIKEAPLDFIVSDSQVDDLIEAAVNKMKAGK